MSKQQRETIDQMLRDAPFDLGGDVLIQRPLLEQMLTSHPLAHDVHTTSGELGGVPAVFIEIGDTEPKGVIFHIHGGGFALGSATSSVGFASDLARKAGMSAITVDYRLAPEHPYPAALHDVTAAYQALLERESSGAQIVLSGESSGGNLALELLIAVKQRGLAMPAAAVLFSPMTDLTVTGDSYTTKADVDPNITAAAIQTRPNDYLTDTDPADPLVSPIFADLAGLPPLLVQAGSHEVLARRRHPAGHPSGSQRRRRHPGHHPRCRPRLSSLLRGPRRRRPGSDSRWHLPSGARPGTGHDMT